MQRKFNVMMGGTGRPGTRSICTMCGGKGQHHHTGTKNCMQCGGSGRNLTTNVIDSPYRPHCSSCRGKGKVHLYEYTRCRQCNGIGSRL